jgi:phosphoenolpyruvate carboxylase
VKLFGFHFTYMDIRQDSRIHSEVIDEIFQAAADGKLGDTVKGKIPANYADLSDEEQINVLTQLEGNIDPELFETEIVRETLKSFYVMKQIQEENGETGCHRYIISNTQSSKNMFEVYALARICGWKIDEMTFDIVPLLETVEDLDNGEDILGYMYSHPVYQKHLAARNKRQYVMLGFSDGTKDGGYLKANWSIFTAKENLSGISKDNKVKIIFFDGRGGPPARGGGNTNKFYSSLGDRIEDHEIQLTIQGQTISSNYGTLNSSQYNLEQFFCAGLENTVFKGDVASMNDSQRDIMNNLADLGFEAYNNFKNDPLFVDYLEDVSVLQYYGKTNIGSRPSKRKSNGKLNLADLRAIPFVGAWTQMKQNVPGFYGVGAALKKYEDEGRIDEIKDFYAKSLFFRTLIDNSIQSVVKSYFPLTSYLEEDKKFGQFWKGIFNEYEQTKRLLLYISDQKELMERSPNNKASIELRENIILPLITMQQYALMKVKAIEKGDKNSEKWKAAYEMMIIRAFFGSINASRNAA